MRLNVVIGGMARLAASAALLAGLAAAPALAGDRALFEIVGYSGDGRHFAFEEYGIQDGSGFPYANVYVIDLDADRWVSGTPIRVLLRNEEAALHAAREQARQQAAPKLAALSIVEPGHLIALNGDGEPGDGLRLEFGAVGYVAGELHSQHALSLEIFDAATPDDCALFLGEEAKGFALHLSGDDGTRELHRDTGTLPRSRGCATAYRIYGVVARPDSGTIAGGVAIVSNYPFGFEGPDRRFLAVPLGK
jgi:predicted secreted protein